ncbi:MAG TPA: tetratricopeptide repeat protein [Rhodanobacteraceae bacterium]|nr:tetratricopeptide repeat protein [Rhodanobacteraceae bacterium]
MNLFAELRRRNVLRAGVLYIGGVWALAQGIAQLGPALGAPVWITRWFVVAAVVGLPFWIAVSWFYEITPSGIRRESEIVPDDSTGRSAGRKLDRAIIAVLAIAVALLITNAIWHQSGVSQSGPAVAAIPDKSIAVLPFANESGDKDEGYFSDGLSEDMITTLSQVATLKVISSASSFQYRDSKDSPAAIGSALGVAHLLVGAVQRLRDQVRVTVTLLSARDGSTVWSQHYDRPYRDLFKLQDEIAQSVTGALRTKLVTVPGAVDQSDRPPSGNLDAYNAYLQASGLGGNGSNDDLRKSIEYFDAAIRIDPGYAQAYAMKSGAWTALAGSLGGQQAQDAYTQAQQAADAALTLDQNLALGHMARGYLLYSRNYDWAGAVAEFKRALQLAPNNDRARALLGQALATLGQVRQGIELTRGALLVDPLSSTSYQGLFLYYLGVGQLDDAERAIRTQMTLQKNNDVLYGSLATIDILRGNATSALQNAKRVANAPWNDIFGAMALQAGKNRVAADAALKLVVEKYATDGPYQIAQIYGVRDDANGVFAWLDKAWAAHDPGIQQVLYDPFVLKFRNDPRFAVFCAKAGLPATTDAKVTQ